MSFPRQAASGQNNAWQRSVLVGIFVGLLVLPSTALGAQDLVDLVEQVKHSVVNISTTQIIKPEGRPGMDQDNPLHDFFGEDFFNRFFGGMPQRERKATALGSGFIISSDGLILTNHHVVAKASEIKVVLDNQTEFEAKVIGSDPQTDLALIQVKPNQGFPAPAKLGNSDGIRVGSEVIAVGNPFGLGQTVTSGIISAKGRVIGAGPYDDFLQTDAAINPGNSGGPLFDMQGQVIGINTAIVAQGQGIGFAIPINVAVQLLPQLKKGKIVRGWLGVMIQDLTKDLADALGLKETAGVLVSDVVKGGPADKAGIKRGDVIVQVDGKEIKEAHSLSRMIASEQPGSKVEITVIRKGERKTIPVALGTLPESGTAAKPKKERPQPQEKWGLSVQELTPELAQRLGLPSEEGGVVVVNVDPNSPAGQSGLEQGDLIREIDHQPVKNLADFNRLVQNSNQNRMLLLVRRGAGTVYIVLKK